MLRTNRSANGLLLLTVAGAAGVATFTGCAKSTEDNTFTPAGGTGGSVIIGGAGGTPITGTGGTVITSGKYPTNLGSSGETLGAGFAAATPPLDPATEKTALDAAKPTAAAPTPVYPLPNSLIPMNLAPIEIQVKRNGGGQTVARINFHAEKDTEKFDWNVYDTCKDAELDSSVCVIAIPAAACTSIAQASQNAPLTITARVAAPDGSNAGEAAFDNVSWTYAELAGGIYYWSTAGGGEIRRYNFAGDVTAPEIYWQYTDSPGVIYPQDYTKPSLSNSWTEDHSCMGCHAITSKGNIIAMSFGGSLPGAMGIYNVADKTPIFATWAPGYPVDGGASDPDAGGPLQKLDGTVPFGTFTTFNPEGTRMINSARVDLYMRNVDTTASLVGKLSLNVNEPKTHPFWSPKGDKLVFTTYVPNPNHSAQTDPTGGTTGDIASQGEIWIADSDGTEITSAARVLVPREGKTATNFYPSIASDGKFVIFNKTVCGNSMGAVTNGWSSDSCDGYDDPGAGLWLTTVDGAAPVFLANASGQLAGGNQPLSDSWARWSPDTGEFRGDTIAWIAFSSRRAYGARTPELNLSTPVHPQLWFAAVKISNDKPTADVSFAPVWLPGQNKDMANPDGNHIPQWVTEIVTQIK